MTTHNQTFWIDDQHRIRKYVSSRQSVFTGQTGIRATTYRDFDAGLKVEAPPANETGELVEPEN